MKLDIKSIFVGALIGIIGIISFFLIIGDVDIQTDFQFGEKLHQANKDISIIIEKNIDENGEEIIIIEAIGKGSVNKADIETELKKICIKKNIDTTSGIEVNITLDNEIDFE